jgi:hypothetical protein
MTINSFISTLAMTLAFTAGTIGCAVQDTKPDKTETELIKIEAELTEIEATVTELNKTSRSVTLMGPEGNSITLDAGDEVRNFDQLEVGDKVDAEYFESYAIFVAKADDVLPQMNTQVDVTLAPLGGKPGMTEVAAVEIHANIVAIDRENRMVTLKGPEGNTETHKVLDESIDLSQVEVGDRVVVQATQSIVVTVKTKGSSE